jgi:hypothetical protein
MQRTALVLLFTLYAHAADTGADLLLAAKQGQAEKVSALLAKGSPVDARDKDGRTPLMLAAMRGHVDAVAALLEHGAKADARDRLGWTAFGLAIFSSASGRDAVLKALPPHPPLRLMLKSSWSAQDLVTSCFQLPTQLRDQVAGLQEDVRVAAAFRDFALAKGKNVVEIVADDGDATLQLTVHPGASCVQQQSMDTLTLLIDARLTAGGQSVLFEKTYGSGLRAMTHVWKATSPAQYETAFEELTKPYMGQIFWVVLEAWLRRQ